MILPPHPPRIESLKALLSDRKKADSTGDKGSQDISLAQKQRPIFQHYYHFLSVTGHSAFELTSQTEECSSQLSEMEYSAVVSYVSNIVMGIIVPNRPTNKRLL